MRNQEYKDDQKVFAFINSDKCETYNDLTKFLALNRLPLIERWVFYFFGKHNWIDDKTIDQIDNTDYDTYGGFIIGDIYYWKEYLKNENQQKENIKNFLIANGKVSNSEIIQEIFINDGWEYVSEKLSNDRDTAYRIHKSAEPDEHNYDSLSNYSLCNFCQQSPCMCSDPDAD